MLWGPRRERAPQTGGLPACTGARAEVQKAVRSPWAGRPRKPPTREPEELSEASCGATQHEPEGSKKYRLRHSSSQFPGLGLRVGGKLMNWWLNGTLF